MEVPFTDEQFTRVELASVLIFAVAVAVMVGPGVVTIANVDSTLVTAVAASLIGGLAFLVATGTVILLKRL